MNQKDKQSLISNISIIAKKLDDNSKQMKEIQAQLERIEYKIDLLLSSKTFKGGIDIPKKKVFYS